MGDDGIVEDAGDMHFGAAFDTVYSKTASACRGSPSSWRSNEPSKRMSSSDLMMGAAAEFQKSVLKKSASENSRKNDLAVSSAAASRDPRPLARRSGPRRCTCFPWPA